MPKNKIQLQKGLSLPKFLKAYGTEEDCKNRLGPMAIKGLNALNVVADTIIL